MYTKQVVLKIRHLIGLGRELSYTDYPGSGTPINAFGTRHMLVP